jgi:ribosome-associated heat shock protein Hsp15
VLSRGREPEDDEDDDADDAGGPVRLDKWLWAARFFRTRSIARKAIEAGHVRYEGERTKVGRAVQVGATVLVRQGWDEREVRIKALSDQRRGAPEAQALYEETLESRERRERQALARRGAAGLVPEGRPDKKQRRDLERFRRRQVE